MVYVSARKRAQSAIASLKASILADKATRAHPQFPKIQQGVARLDALLAPLDDRLTSALDDCLTAAPTEQPTARQKAVMILEDYRQKVADEPLLRQLDAGSGYGAFPVYKPLVAALDNIRNQLEA
jgi:hypothetical protein